MAGLRAAPCSLTYLLLQDSKRFGYCVARWGANGFIAIAVAIAVAIAGTRPECVVGAAQTCPGDPIRPLFLTCCNLG